MPLAKLVSYQRAPDDPNPATLVYYFDSINLLEAYKTTSWSSVSLSQRKYLRSLRKKEEQTILGCRGQGSNRHKVIIVSVTTTFPYDFTRYTRSFSGPLNYRPAVSFLWNKTYN